MLIDLFSGVPWMLCEPSLIWLFHVLTLLRTLVDNVSCWSFAPSQRGLWVKICADFGSTTRKSANRLSVGCHQDPLLRPYPAKIERISVRHLMITAILFTGALASSMAICMVAEGISHRNRSASLRIS